MSENTDKTASSEDVIYKTSDLYFSAYLCAIDVTMVTTETDTSEGNRKIVFVFRVPRKDFERLKTSYFGGSGTVKVQKYVQALRSLKSLCFV